MTMFDEAQQPELPKVRPVIGWPGDRDELAAARKGRSA